MAQLLDSLAASDWNGPVLDFPERDACIHQLIEAQATKLPGKIAIDFEGRTITYHELNRQANQLAHWLQNHGVGKEALVAICVERSIEMIVALVGVLKSGGAYVPLDPEFPPDRLRYMLEDSKPAVLLTQTSLAPLLEGLGSSIESFCVDRDAHLIAQQPTHNPRSSVSPDGRAYVIYTSGSTGRPKGCELIHHGVVNFIKSMALVPGMDESDVVMAATTVSFDIAVLELLMPLAVGARIALASRATARTPQSAGKLLREKSVTIAQGAPTSWRLLVDSGWEGQANLKILCGGEAFPRDLANELVSRVPVVWNMYGPTETTIWSTIHRVTAGTQSVPIGRPIHNTQIYILDSNLRPVPPGELGEIFIGGDGLARGYLNKPEITAERFIPNPTPGQPSPRIYRTGDLGRFLPNGDIQYEGRCDHQIKIHGVRVEPEEIEKPILEFAGVKQCLVVARVDATGDKRLVAYIVPSAGETIQSAALRQHLTTKLPKYLVPAAVVCLPEFPVTFNGKVDRKALPDPEQQAVNASHGVAEGPHDDIEYRLVTIWEDVLRVKPVGLRDNFFDLGGHSLLAARLLGRIEQSMGKELPLAALLDAPTIEEQANIIRGHNGSNGPHAGNRRPEIPLFYLGADPTFQPLSQRLRALHPFHSLGIQASLVRTLADRSLESIARHFVAAIRERRPHGPYMLGGWCAHGLLAFEAAQQLRAAGEDVALVMMLETANPAALRDGGAWVRWVRRAQLKTNLLHFEYTYIRGLTRERARDYVSGRLRRKFSRMGRGLGRNQGASPDQLAIDEQNLLTIVYAAANRYVPKPYDDPITLVRSDKNLFGVPHDPPLGWDASLCPKLELCQCEGNHYTMYIEPNVDRLAIKMAACLKSADERAREQTYSARPLI
ncbi:MAG TPA: amino acid adenylation domain-containing protein [Candidatus Acidoferrales bacterium]|nr:amino acid adenylation domain-containing protein [Candidatus Acidoferrales bacterium]